MNQDMLVWDEDDGRDVNRLQNAIKAQSEQEREELLDQQRRVKKINLIRRLVSVPFWIVYGLVLTRIAFDIIDSWSLREEHQLIVSITEPFLGMFMELAIVDLGFGVSLNPSHFLALGTIIALHLGVMVFVRLMR